MATHKMQRKKISVHYYILLNMFYYSWRIQEKQIIRFSDQVPVYDTYSLFYIVLYGFCMNKQCTNCSMCCVYFACRSSLIHSYSTEMRCIHTQHGEAMMHLNWKSFHTRRYPHRYHPRQYQSYIALALIKFIIRFYEWNLFFFFSIYVQHSNNFSQSFLLFFYLLLARIHFEFHT